MKEKISRKAIIHAGFKSIAGPTMYKIGPKKIAELLPQLQAKQFSAELFLKTGVFVIRQAITQECVF